MAENMEAATLDVPAETLDALDAASSPDWGHPYSMLEWDMPMTLGYAGMFEQIDIPNFPNKLRK